MIAFDAASQGSALPGNSITFAHTISGSNRYLIVAISSNNADVITGVTYDGVAMTLLKKSTFTGPTLYIFGLVAPNTGTHNIVVSASGAGEYLRATAASYTGVQQSGQPDATDEETASAAALTSSLTQTVTNAWQVGMAQGGHDGVVTAGSGIGAIRATTTGGYNSLGDSNATTTPGTRSMTWNQGGSAQITGLQVSLIDVVQVSPSASLSPSASISPSVSPSASRSPSSSSSASLSPSASVSPSSSASRSVSPSSSLSPSSSASSSSSASLSPSSSASQSPSASISASTSPSGSLSPSASPSAGYSNFTRGAISVLPTDDSDMPTVFTDEEEVKVEKLDDIVVTQPGVLQYMVQLFKIFVGAQTLATIYWEGQSTLAPNQSIVSLQIYNRQTNVWETIASNNAAPEDTDFELTDTIQNLTKYKDSNSVIACRVQQLAI